MDNDFYIHQNFNLYSTFRVLIFNNLIGVASKKMRGITLNYDHNIKHVEVIMIFDEDLKDVENDAMQLVYTKVILGIPNNEVPDSIVLNIKVIPSFETIHSETGNWGWLYRRYEYGIKTSLNS